MTDFRARKAAERLQEGHAALERGALETAASAFEHALRLDPASDGARAGWQAWAECLERQGKSIAAARVATRALEHHPDDPALQLGLVHAQIEIGRFADARRRVEALCEQWPGQRQPIAYLARILRDTRELTALAELLDELASGSGPLADDRELRALRASCASWMGAGTREPRRPPESMRERIRRRFGAVLLGTGHDDGLAIPWYSTYLCSNYDVVATCGRLLGFADRFGWTWAAAAAVDPAAEVLAELIAGALGIPVVRADALPDAVGDPQTTLAIASFVEPGWGHGEVGAWARRCADAGNLFAFGALQYGRHTRPLPPILGMAAGERVCLPWWRLGEARIGFSRVGLIEPLAPEIDPRTPEAIADDYRGALAEFELGPNFDAAARDVHEHRAELQAGLRARSDFARIPARTPPRPGPIGTVEDALAQGSTAEFLRALGPLERDHGRIGPAQLDQLEARFVASPEVRSRLSDLLYRVAPERFTTLLERLVSRPEREVRPSERDGLLHLFGCNPWGERATEQLRRWLEIGSMSNRSEIVQSKYGLHHLAEPPAAFGEVLAILFADAVPVVLGTLRWLHDNPHLHGHVAEHVVPLLDHPHPDVVFEALQCTRVAGHALELARLEGLAESASPRLRSAAIEHFELLDPGIVGPRLAALMGEGTPCEVVWAAARSLIRAGDLPARCEGGRRVAERIVALEASGDVCRELLRALATAEDFEVLAAVLEVCRAPAIAKVVAAALTPALLRFDDPRLLPHLRESSEAFGLDPAPGYAAYLLRHGDPARDLDAVVGAQGSTDVAAGYEAKAALARWGDANAREELRRAWSYREPFAEAAFAAWFEVATPTLAAEDYPHLEAARDDPARARVVWRVLVRRSDDPTWVAGAREQLRASWQREAAWAGFIEDRLRGQIPSKFVVGAVCADFGVSARLLPNHFDDLVSTTLAGTPDRFCLDLFEWLGAHDPPRARTWAARLADAPHWGVRSAARRVLSSG